MKAEPLVSINEQSLTVAQAATIRVAVANFLMLLADPDFIKHLGPIGGAYRDRLLEIERIMGVRP